ncbi:hypothetical protein [Streptomyces lutosisoli]|uniref:Non-reducing end beta-L-arabinofuranosidase-like GH127 C-terminal domain-containing protein n=1 Tax=Streptomyces lutosisoli TaxID=2665721 RepID=A0ABW2VB62_9ACTN
MWWSGTRWRLRAVGRGERGARPDGRPDRHAHALALLNGVTVVTAEGHRRSDGSAVRLTAVPYYAWANRRDGAMRVWIPES